MDPSQVDIRTFYPYTPNEVKHRKRTTRAQLKVLESVYKYDTKPNASLRKKLAAELDMTPRGVQVWFQNRRAKTKQQAKKAEAAAVAGSKLSSDDPSASSSNPAAADGDDDDDDDDDDLKDEDDPSPALPASPQPPHISEETSPDNSASSAPSEATLSNATESESPPDSRRGSIAHPNSLPNWPGSSPSASSASATASAPSPSSTIPSPTISGHASAHLRLSTHPPSTTPYSHTHLAPPDLYSQRRTSLPVASLSPSLGHGTRLGLQKRGFDPSVRRRSIDNRMSAHPYMHVAANVNGQGNNPHSALIEGDQPASHPQQMMRRPQLMPRLSAPFASNPHQGHSAQGAHSMPVVPSQLSRPQLGNQRQYDISPIPVGISPSVYNGAGGQGYDLFAPRHSIDGSALGLMQAHAQMNIAMHGANAQMNSGMDGSETYSMGMGIAPHDTRGYVLSQRPIQPPVPGPLPSPNFSFGNPFVPGANSSNPSSHSGTPPNGSSPSLLAVHRRTSEGGASDADTEESSAGPLSRFGSVASLGGSEVSWTSAYTSEGGHEGEEANICASRRESCASSNGRFLEMFSDLDVGSNGGTPAPPGLHDQRSVPSATHLSPNHYSHHVLSHSPDGSAGHQHLHSPAEGDGGYPSPSSASTISAGSNHSQHGSPHENSSQHPNVASGSGRKASGHVRTNTSSELAYALSGEPEVSQTYGQGNPAHDSPQLHYPVYTPESAEGEYRYGQQEHPHHHQDYSKAQMGHFPTVYEEYVYPSDGQVLGDGTGPMNETHAAGAIELSHMCVPASEVHFMGGYMQYS
ncbi:hypothetical protein C8Q80DRAFT_1122152 [Daedaleopsis nitida]|nr:hypothetical protein C8Q80DRAFT_1122152 [Daedaleopsis nitida]